MAFDEGHCVRFGVLVTPVCVSVCVPVTHVFG